MLDWKISSIFRILELLKPKFTLIAISNLKIRNTISLTLKVKIKSILVEKGDQFLE